MDYQCVFKRYEIKFILTAAQADSLKEVMRGYMQGDRFGLSSVCSLYYDTPDFLLARRSIEKPFYKEKVRLRSYGVISSDGRAFAEIKKKCNGVVYKRREVMTERSATSCFNGAEAFPDTQIGRELAFCLERYRGLRPAAFISYKREAFCGRQEKTLRLTFDRDILWRDYDLNLKSGLYGERILEADKVLLEVKTTGAMPLWLVKFLSENKIYKTTFSKYGLAYAAIAEGEKNKGGLNCA